MMEKYLATQVEKGKEKETPPMMEKTPARSSKLELMSGRIEGSCGNTPTHEFHGWRLELPVFEGENPDGWVFRAERYFLMNAMFKMEKVEATAICFDSDALAWYQWADGWRPFSNWYELKMLLERFRAS